MTMARRLGIGIVLILWAFVLLALQLYYPARRTAASLTYYTEKLEQQGFYQELHQFILEMQTPQGDAGIVDQILHQVVSEAMTPEWVRIQTLIVVSGSLEYILSQTKDLPVLEYDYLSERILQRGMALLGHLPLSPLLEELGRVLLRRTLEAALAEWTAQAPFTQAWYQGEGTTAAQFLEDSRSLVLRMDRLQRICITGLAVLTLLLAYLLYKEKRLLAGLSTGFVLSALGAVLAAYWFPGYIEGLLYEALPDLAIRFPSIGRMVRDMAEDLAGLALRIGLINGLMGICLLTVHWIRKGNQLRKRVAHP